MLIGGCFSLIAYKSWSFLASAYDSQCTGTTPASNCASLASSAGVWGLQTVAFLTLLCVGLAVTIGGARMEARAARPMSR